MYDRVEPVGQGDDRWIHQRKLNNLGIPSFGLCPVSFRFFFFFLFIVEGGTHSFVAIGLRSTSTRLSGRHVRQRNWSSLVLPLRRLQISRSGFALPQGGSQWAMAIVDVADASRSDVKIRSGQTSRLHLSWRRIRPCGWWRLRCLLHYCRRELDFLPHFIQAILARDGESFPYFCIHRSRVGEPTNSSHDMLDLNSFFLYDETFFCVRVSYIKIVIVCVFLFFLFFSFGWISGEGFEPVRPANHQCPGWH